MQLKGTSAYQVQIDGLGYSSLFSLFIFHY